MSYLGRMQASVQGCSIHLASPQPRGTLPVALDYRTEVSPSDFKVEWVESTEHGVEVWGGRVAAVITDGGDHEQRGRSFRQEGASMNR